VCGLFGDARRAVEDDSQQSRVTDQGSRMRRQGSARITSFLTISTAR
jgi:hypothetical protein